MRFTHCGAAAVLLCATSALPSEVPTLAPGTRVRITVPSTGAEALVGTLVRREADALWVSLGRSDSPTRIHLDLTTRIEVSAGRRTQASRGALIGGAVGAVPGLLLTFGDYSSDVHGDGPSPGAVAAVGAAAGAAVGAAVGWALKTEEWLHVERPAVAAWVTPLRGGGLGVSLRVAWGGCIGFRMPAGGHRDRDEAGDQDREVERPRDRLEVRERPGRRVDR